MSLPFTVDQFLSVFSAYNAAVWPMQLVLAGIAILLLIIVLRNGASSAHLPALGLALIWSWSGVVYHLLFFRSINGAALVFGAVFLIQAGILALEGMRSTLQFRFTDSPQGWAGAALILYALVAYPILGYLLGHRYPASPTFGAPCPLVIFTTGLLLWSTRPLRWYEYAVPVAWAVIGTSAALQLGMVEDFGLSIAALALLAAKAWGRTGRGPAVGMSAAR